jgi:flagellar motor protein MotB
MASGWNRSRVVRPRPPVVVSPAVATQEYPSPSRSASGQLNASTGNRQRMPTGATGQQPSLFATRPLPEQSPAAQYARPTEQPQQQMPVAPMPVAPAGYAAAQTAAYGQASQTAAYGQPGYAVKPPSGAPAKPKARKTASMPTVKPSMTAPMPAVPGQNSGWQASLPVAPWSAYERKSGPVTGLETETVLRSDLKSLKRSRTRAWLLFAGVLVVAGTSLHFLLRTMEKNATSLREMKTSYEALLKNQGAGGGGIAYEAAARPALRQGSRPAQIPAPSMAPPSAGPPTASAKALAEELKRQLMGDAAITVEPRGERVIVSMDEASLFTGNATAVGQEGFRLLYRFGKGIKNVRDRRIVVGVTSSATRPRAWIIAAARGVSLGRFLLDDLSVEPGRVLVSTPAPTPPGSPAGKGDRIEFSLELVGDSGRA